MTLEEKQKKVKEILSRGVADFVDPDGSFEKKLMGKVDGSYDGDVVIKLGADPTRPDIHIGHAVLLRKLRQFQDLGCKVVFIVGDFTTMIGDPTGKSKVRPELDQKQIEENMKTYVEQIGKILRTDKEVFAWIRNSDWFTNITDIAVDPTKNVTISFEKDGAKTSFDVPGNSFLGKTGLFENTRMQKQFTDKISVITTRLFLAMLRRVTHSQLIDRDMFQERLKKGEELYMHEMMYPVLQGIDSTVIARVFGSCDLEMGGTDQTFNMLMGRDAMKVSNQEQQAVMSMELIEGLDGKEKMSKSLDNYVAITDAPQDMYGKIMSLPDVLVSKYFRLCTFTPLEEIPEIEKHMQANPMEVKKRLAREITAQYHGDAGADEGECFFTETFQNKEIPTGIPELSGAGKKMMEILVSEGVVKSNTEYRRLVADGAITNLTSDTKIEDEGYVCEENTTYRIGKKRFVKIV
jgi:tyrosyl-tRNA synthetase